MAHAGTPTGLAQQPAASSWKPFLSLIVILAIGVGLVIAVPLIAGGRAATAPAVDRSYDQIESARGAATLSGVSVDTSYTSVENLRAQSGVTVNTDNAVLKAAAAKAQAMSGVAAGTAAQSARQFDPMVPAATGTKLDATSFDRKYQELQFRAGNGMLP